MNARAAGLAALAAVAIASGFGWGLRDNYVMDLFILASLYGLWSVAWNMNAGFVGLVSLGHALFIGTGAYAVAYLYAAFGISPWLGAPIGVVLAVLMALGIGYLSFRYGLRGHYFALVTLAFSEIGFLLVSSTTVLGRSDGLMMPLKHPGFAYLQFESKWPYALMAMVLLVLALLCAIMLLRSRTGYYWRAIRDNEEAAAALGVSTFKFKQYAVGLSAAWAALGGALFAQYAAFVDPGTVMGVGLSIQILLFAIIGGMGVLWGPILGAALLIPAGEVLRGLFGTTLPGTHLVMYALLLIVVALRLPGGVGGWINAWIKRGARRGPATATGQALPSDSTGVEK